MTSGVLYKRRAGTNIWDAPGRPSLGIAARVSNYSDPSYVASAANTGPVEGTSLAVRYVSAAGALSTNPADDDFGVYTISTANATIENLEIRGGIKITAANVTVRNCDLHGQQAALSAGVWRATVDVQDNNAAGYHILDTRIRNAHATELHLGVYGDAGGTVERCDISGGVDGGRTWGPAFSLLGNWIHDLDDFPVSAYTPADGPHCDGWQFAPAAYTGAQVVQGNTFDIGDAQPITSTNLGPSAIMLPQQITDLTIDNNDFLGVTCWPINVGGNGAPNGGTVLTITNNRITPGWYVSSGTTGHIIARPDWQAIWTQTGNTDYATGGAIRVKNG